MLKQKIGCLLAACLLANTLINAAWAKAETKAGYQAFIPHNWKLLEKVQGDLNGDGQADLALIIEETSPENIVKNDSLGSPELNLNPRKLLVLFKNPQAYQLAASNDFLPSEGDAESPCLADPLAEGEALAIKNGLLKIGLHYWLSCGSWYVTNHLYTFRYQDQSFKLIGYDSNDFHRASGDITERSINFLTGKVKSTSGKNEFAESRQPVKTEWTKLKNKYSLNLEQVKFNEHYEFE